jgi:hypothetical protein
VNFIVAAGHVRLGMRGESGRRRHDRERISLGLKHGLQCRLAPGLQGRRTQARAEDTEGGRVCTYLPAIDPKGFQGRDDLADRIGHSVRYTPGLVSAPFFSVRH